MVSWQSDPENTKESILPVCDNLITRSKKICRLGRSLKNCGTIHYSYTLTCCSSQLHRALEFQIPIAELDKSLDKHGRHHGTVQLHIDVAFTLHLPCDRQLVLKSDDLEHHGIGASHRDTFVEDFHIGESFDVVWTCDVHEEYDHLLFILARVVSRPFTRHDLITWIWQELGLYKSTHIYQLILR